MNALARSIVGVAVTAAAVYLMDPANGHRRRLMLRDQCTRAARRMELGTRDVRNDASEHARGFASRTRSALGRDRKSDKAVSKSVCGVIRQTVSHPESVAVAVDHGHVILRGSLLPHEHQRLLDDVRRQPGVTIVTDHLTEHRNGNGEYSLDAGREFRTAARTGGWVKAGRVLAGCAGGALLIWGVRERKALGAFGAAVAEELQRTVDAVEQNLREGADAAKETVEAAEEGLTDAARGSAQKVEEGLEWAESVSSDALDEYAQARRRQAEVAEVAL